MDKLNTAIAEKVLEISNAENIEVRDKLQKINRFRDFTNACQSLIKKYPEIEDELLQMIKDNDFDARIASARVDTIIRLSENKEINNTISDVEDDIHQLEDIIDSLPITTNIEAKLDNISENEDSSISTIKSNEDLTNIESKSQNLSIDGKETKTLPEVEPIDIEKEKQYVDFEEIDDTENSVDSANITNAINSHEQPNISIDDKKSKISGISSLKKILWILGFIAIIIVLYIVIKFVISHWSTILWILGGCVVVALLFWYFSKQKKKS